MQEGVGHVENGVVIICAVIRNCLIKKIDICIKFSRGEEWTVYPREKVFQKREKAVQKP